MKHDDRASPPSTVQLRWRAFAFALGHQLLAVFLWRTLGTNLNIHGGAIDVAAFVFILLGLFPGVLLSAVLPDSDAFGIAVMLVANLAIYTLLYSWWLRSRVQSAYTDSDSPAV